MAQEQHIQQELKRQQLLGELGFAAWVAQTPLPGAISSQVLGEKPSKAPAAPKAPPRAQAPQPQAAAPQSTTESPFAQVMKELGGASKAKRTPQPQIIEPEPIAEAAPEKPKGTPYVFTLHAFAMPFGYLLVEQQDPKAPEFSREEQGLLKNFSALWGGIHQRAKVFQCPVGGQPMYQADAKEFLQGFMSGLEETITAPNNKVLILASETIAELLVETRYQLSDQRLAVSSLAEMLADPLVHKRQSWQAMLQAEFYAKAQH